MSSQEAEAMHEADEAVADADRKLEELMTGRCPPVPGAGVICCTTFYWPVGLSEGQERVPVG